MAPSTLPRPALCPILALTGLLFLAVGCGSDEFQQEYVPIALESETQGHTPSPKVFRRYVPGKGSPQWHPAAEKSRFTEVPKVPRKDPTQNVSLKPAFLVQGRGLKTLSIRDQLDPIQFNRIEVEATVFGSGNPGKKEPTPQERLKETEFFSVELIRQGEVLASSPQLPLEADNQAPHHPGV